METFIANNQGAINQTIDTGILAPGFFGPLSPGSRVGDTYLSFTAAADGMVRVHRTVSPANAPESWQRICPSRPWMWAFIANR